MQTFSKQRIAGWIISVLLAAFLIVGSLMGQFVQWEGKAEHLQHIGYTEELTAKIGYLSMILSVLFLIPRTSFLGAILLTGYFGGAIATHVRVADPFIMPLIFGVLVWVSLGLRNSEIFRMVMRSSMDTPSEG